MYKYCFQYDMTYGDFKDSTRRKDSDKTLRDKAYDIAKNLKYDSDHLGLALIVYKVFDKKTSGGTAKNKNNSNKESYY